MCGHKCFQKAGLLTSWCVCRLVGQVIQFFNLKYVISFRDNTVEFNLYVIATLCLAILFRFKYFDFDSYENVRCCYRYCRRCHQDQEVILFYQYDI